MKAFPEAPPSGATPDLFERGHLWLLELIDGTPLRFEMLESGALRFGDRTRVFGDEIPLGHRCAVRYVRERFDRDGLRTAVDDAESVVFFGRTTDRRSIDYDWDRLPPFVGYDVWSGAAGRHLPPDAVESIYRRLGLRAANAFEKEVRAADFDPDDYRIPDSAWYDGPAAGVLVRDKTGGRAAIRRSDSRPPERDVERQTSAAEIARRYATRTRFEAVAARLDERGRPATVDAIRERVVEDVAREARVDLGADGFDLRAFRSEVAARAHAFVTDRNGG